MLDHQKYIDRYLDKVSIMLLIFPFMYFCAILLWHRVPNILTLADYAVLEISTRNLFSNRILLGPYSRFLFFHPGPLYFFLRYPIYALFAYRSGAFLIVSGLISSGSIFGAWSIIKRELGRSFAFAFSGVLILFLFNSEILFFLSDWNPHIIILPLMLFCISICSIAIRSSRYLLITVISGSLVAQTHIAGIPTLGIVSILCLLGVIYPRILSSSSNSFRLISFNRILISFLLLVLIWLPPLYEQITAVNKGNITNIIEIFDNNDPGISPQQAFHAWSGRVTDFELRKVIQDDQHSNYLIYARVSVIAFRLLLLSIGYGLLRRKGRYGFLCILNLVCIALHGITLYSTTQIRGLLYPFLVDWMIIISPISLFAIIASFFQVFREYLSRNMIIKAAIYAVLPLMVYFSFSNSRDVSDHYDEVIRRSQEGNLGVEELSDELSGFMNSGPEACYIFKLDKWDNWRLMVSIVNILDKEGHTIRIDNNIWYKSPPLPPGTIMHTMQFVDIDSIGASESQMVASYNKIGILLEYDDDFLFQ